MATLVPVGQGPSQAATKPSRLHVGTRLGHLVQQRKDKSQNSGPHSALQSRHALVRHQLGQPHGTKE